MLHAADSMVLAVASMALLLCLSVIDMKLQYKKRTRVRTCMCHILTGDIYSRRTLRRAPFRSRFGLSVGRIFALSVGRVFGAQ